MTSGRPIGLMGRVLPAASVLLLGLLLSPARALSQDGQFTLGAADGSSAEFALAPDGYSQFPARFPDGVDFTVGADDPGADWSYIHPGPRDGWAGGRAHDFTIRYEVPADGVADHRLVLRYVDTNPFFPPQVEVVSNGTSVATRAVPAGGGGGATGGGNVSPHTLSVTIPAATLHTGANAITIRHPQGSWTVYDAIELRRGGAGAPAIEIDRAQPTVLFVEREGRELQLVDVSVNNLGGPGRVTFTADAGGRSAVTEADVPEGVSTHRVRVPPAPGPGSVPLRISVEPGTERLETELPYQRRWEFHIDHGSHLDIGYTALQPVVEDQQNDILDQAVDACEDTAGYPDASKFRWGAESMWVLDNYVRERPPSRIDRLKACVKSGQIELSGSYVNNLHDLSSPEELVRQVYAGARRFEQRFSVDVVSAFENDAPAVTWQYVQALSKAGIDNLVVGANPTRAPQAATKPSLFWWEAPNGNRLLTWYTGPDTHYGELYFLTPSFGDLMANFDASVSAIDRRLRTVQGQGFEHDLYLAMMRQDNVPAQTNISEFAKRFNETYTWPRVIVSTPKRFFDAVEERGTGDLPINRGDWSDWWVDGAGSSARETDLTRDAQDRTVVAETLGALATLTTPSDGRRQAQLDEAHRQTLLYDEHTWGASRPSWTDPQWDYKRAFAEDADELSRQGLASALEDLSARVRNGSPWPSVAVFNALSWQRSDTVEVSVPEGRLGGRPFRLYDGDREVPYELLSREDGTIRLRFVARDVPSVGYRTFDLRPAGGDGGEQAALDRALRASESGLENEYYRVRLDAETGAIASIVDKVSGRELVDQDSPYGLNQFIYRPNDAGADKWNMRPTSAAREWSPAGADVRVVSSGPVSATLEITHDTAPGGAVTGVRGLTERITLHAGLRRIAISNTVDKERVETAEEAYYAFPFEVDHPQVRYEIPGAHVDFFEDQLPGSALDWQAVGRYIDLTNAGGGVTLATESAPLVELDRIRTQEFETRPGRLDGRPDGVDPSAYAPDTGSVFSYTHNNLWGTNYRIAQEGPVTFDYSITSHEPGFDPVRESRYGWGAHAELEAAAVGARRHGPYAPGARSFVEVEQPNVVVQTIKRADGGRPGLVVRLREVVGRDGSATLTLPFQVGTASLADVTERPQRPLRVSGRQVTVPLERHGIVTVLVTPPLALTATASTTTVARGEKIDVTVGLENETQRTLSGTLSLDGPAGVAITPEQARFDGVEPGGRASATFEVAVDAGAPAGPVTLTATADTRGAEATPVKLTLDVVDPIELVATPAELDLTEAVASLIEVTVTNNLPRATSAAVGLELPGGWAGDPATRTVALEPTESKTLAFTVTPPEGSFGRHELNVVAEGDWPTSRTELPATVGDPLFVAGRPDRDAGEFALAPAGYNRYPSTFPSDVDFTAGEDAPGADWSYIHPGPIDIWAGSRDHPFTLRFALDEVPAHDLTLTAWLLDTQEAAPPVVRLSLNGAELEVRQLPAGGGDGYHWGDGEPNEAGGIRPTSFSVELPAGRLRAGENVLTIGRPAGSWLVYDALALRRVPE